jgi:hypothetical protein
MACNQKKIALVTTSLHAVNEIAECRIKENQERARSTLSTTHVCTRRSGGVTANLRAYAIRAENKAGLFGQEGGKHDA